MSLYASPSGKIQPIAFRKIIAGLWDDRDQSVVIDSENGFTIAHYRVHPMAVPLPEDWPYWWLISRGKERLSVLHIASPIHLERLPFKERNLPWGFIDGMGRTAALAQAMKGYRPKVVDLTDIDAWIDKGRCGVSALDYYHAIHDDIAYMMINVKLKSKNDALERNHDHSM